MEYNFERYLFDKLSRVAIELQYDDIKIYVSKEQMFNQMDKLTPDTIYVVIKYLSSDIEFYAETMPIQILVLSEQNSLEKAQMIMNKFANDNNWRMIEDNGTFIKQQYNSPVVLSNYSEVGYGYRSVLYVTGTLFILEKVMDVTDLTVTLDNEPIEIKAISSTIGYTMTGDTQPFNGGYAKTEKSFATFAMTINISCVETAFTKKCVEIMNQTSSEKGNETFTFNFKVGEIPFNNFEMKLIGVTIVTAVNNVPSLQLSFSV